MVTVLGNGESRLRANFTVSKPLYACNLAFRAFYVDHLVCCDRKMVETAQIEGFGNRLYTRPQWNDYYHCHAVPEFHWKETEKYTQHWHWGSGLHAVHLALTHGHNDLELAGFDLIDSTEPNNVYLGNEHYENKVVPPWMYIKQFDLLMHKFPGAHFTFIQAENYQWEPRFTADNFEIKI